MSDSERKYETKRVTAILVICRKYGMDAIAVAKQVAERRGVAYKLFEKQMAL